jgi:hypothetical protein
LTDNRHCGAGADCVAEPGVACQDGFVCNGAGQCELSCQTGLVDCAGTCINPATSHLFCGAGPDCSANPGVACQDGFVCNGTGQCELSCQDGLVDCAGTCINPATSNLFCGAGADCTTNPGVACQGGAVCNGAGQCESSCQGDLIDCAGTCIDPDTSRLFCGAGPDCSVNPGVASDPGFVCNGAGQCELSCQGGLVDCAGTCIDPDSNPLFCGAGTDCDASPGVACGDTGYCDEGTCRPVLVGAHCTDYLAAGLTTNGFYTVMIGGVQRSVYCDMTAGGHMLFSVVHNWGEWGSNMTIVMRDRLTPGVGSLANWDASCALFGRTKYAGGWWNNGGTYSQPAYTVYADSQHYWNTAALARFPSATYNDFVILQDALATDCWAHYAEPGSLQSFGSPAGSGYAFCRGGASASKRYHIYLCL